MSLTFNKHLLLVSDAVADPNLTYEVLLNQLQWQQRGDNGAMVPRKEYYCHGKDLPYTYGKGPGARTYESMPTHPLIEEIRRALNSVNPGVWNFDVMFANLYEHQHHCLGWHADDSPEMDQNHPIVTVSLGAEREIWFKSRILNIDPVQKIVLPHGSALFMMPGVQQTHYHRIPKHDRECGPRISLTFRHYIEPIGNELE